ncbi:Borrelia lipoprotein-containing protein (plasmid) [Borrelia crocidurae str. Achema]|uniref:Variable large protein n=1 Tax=Borrelia crocidurae (strain Achema) TaxID=1155096 RepID=I0FDU0_BORCA|nr:Borrelia lipoprotein-containing protein [Borrelia crocidurae str. Achema]
MWICVGVFSFYKRRGDYGYLGVGKADAWNDKKASDGSNARTAGDGEAGKLFSAAAINSADNAKKSAADVSKAVGAVTGADILQAIVKKGDATVA